MNHIANAILWCLQGVLALALIVPFQLTSKLFAWLGHQLVRGPYYSVSRARRRLSGQPVWQEQDILIGVQRPTDDP